MAYHGPAGRKDPTDQSRKLTELLQKNIPRIEDAELTFAPGMEHRLAVVMRFPHALAKDAADIPDTDPQLEGRQPLKPLGSVKNAERVAAIAEQLIDRAHDILKHEEKANFILMRVFPGDPISRPLNRHMGCAPLPIATYPCTAVLQNSSGMQAPALEGTVEDEIAFLKNNYDSYDFFSCM